MCIGEMGIDFSSLDIKVSDYFELDDENILVRFNHTWDRETFDTNLTTGCPAATTVIDKLDSIQDSLFNTSHANYYHDNVTKEVIVNIGGDDTSASSIYASVKSKFYVSVKYTAEQPESTILNDLNQTFPILVTRSPQTRDLNIVLFSKIANFLGLAESSPQTTVTSSIGFQRGS